MSASHAISHRKGVASALRVLGIASLALILPTETLPFAVKLVQANASAWPGALLLLASQLLALGVLLAGNHWRPAPWLLLALLMAGEALSYRQAGTFDAAELLIPGYWFFPIVVIALGSQRRRHYVGFAAVGALLLMAENVWLLGFASWEDLADLIWIAQPAAEVVLFGDALMRIDQAHARAIARRRKARTEQGRETARIIAQREAARLLHDHVLHALSTIAQVGRWQHSPAAVTPEQAVQESGHAVTVLTQANEHAGSARVEDFIMDDPALLAARAVVHGTTQPVPWLVARTMADAAHEALVNVVRHAHAGRVSVLVSTDDEVVSVHIVDDGRGFDPARRTVDRMGVGGSILQRMDDVGGLATIQTGPNKGTDVSLSWPRPADGGSGPWSDAPERLVRASLSRTAWPGLVTGALMTVLAGPTLAHPLPTMVAAVLALVVGCLAAATLTRTNLPAPARWVVVAVALTAWVVNLVEVRTSPDLDYPLWTGWLASCLVHLLVLTSTRRQAILLAVGWAVAEVAGVMTLGDPLADLGSHTFLLTTGAGDVAITLMVLFVLQGAARHEAAAARMGSMVRSATARMQASAQLDEFWSERVLVDALPFLREIASGAVDPADAAVQTRALRLERQLRDELLLGRDSDDLLTKIARTRDRGWDLVTNLTDESGPGTIADACTLLEILGTSAHAGQRVTISTGIGRTLAVVLEASPEQVARWRRTMTSFEGSIDVDEDFVRLGLVAS